MDKKRQKENFLHPLESYYWYFEAYKENSLMSCICKKFVIEYSRSLIMIHSYAQKINNFRVQQLMSNHHCYFYVICRDFICIALLQNVLEFFYSDKEYGSQCRECLYKILRNARVLRCVLRYEIYPFVNLLNILFFCCSM